MTSPAPSLATTIADHFPWRILAVDMAIPMAGYAVFAAMGNPLAGILFAGVWGIFRTLWKGIRQKSLPFFSSVTILFALVEFITLYWSQDLYWLSLALRSGSYGLLVLGTLFLKKPFIQQIAESGGTSRFTDEFRETPSYRRAWALVTALWSIAYLSKGAFYFLLAPQLDLGTAFAIRTFLGWPLTILLILFSIAFPRWFWQREASKGKIQVAVLQK